MKQEHWFKPRKGRMSALSGNQENAINGKQKALVTAVMDNICEEEEEKSVDIHKDCVV